MLDMPSNRLNFYISFKDGLEFVFSSGQPRSYPLHTHARSFTVTLVRQGLAVLSRPDGSSEAYRPGEVYIDAPNQPHSPFYPQGHDLLSLCVGARQLAEFGLAEMSRLFWGQACILIDQKLMSRENAASLLSGLNRCRLPESHGRYEFFPESGFSFFEECAEKPLTPPFSASTISRYCQKYLGLTPQRYLMQSRIRAAKNLLNANYKIASAAQQAGFYDQSHLNRCFKSSVGLTPKAYLAACRFLPGLSKD